MMIETSTSAELAIPSGPWTGLSRMVAMMKVNSSAGVERAECRTPKALQPAANPQIRM